MSLAKSVELLVVQRWSDKLLKRCRRYEERAKAHLAEDETDVMRQKILQKARQWRQDAELVSDWAHGMQGTAGPDGPEW